MSKTLQRSVFSVSVCLAVAVLAGGFLPPSVRAGGFGHSTAAYTQLSVYEEVLRKIQNFYVVQPSLPNVTSGALHGLLNSLDAESSYLTPDQYKDYKAELAAKSAAANAEQIGVTVSRRSYGAGDPAFVMVDVVPGSPADKAGISPGDVVETLDGQSTHAMSLQMMRLKLEGRAGTTVALGIINPAGDGTTTKTVTRGPVTVPALESKQLSDNSVLYLKPIALSEARVTQVEQQLRGMSKSGETKIVLDLRDTSLGDEAQGVRLANAFLKTGTIASLSGQTYASQTFTADPAKFLTSAPLIVLTNGSTMGAAEIVAAAVLGNNRGNVVGTKTLGAGSIQKTIEMPDGAAMLLSVAKYSAPNGKAIEDTGVQPDTPVTLSIDQFLSPQDNGSKADQAAHPRVDDQLNKALDMLKTKQG